MGKAARVGDMRNVTQEGRPEIEEQPMRAQPTPTTMPRTLKVETLIPEADVRSLLMDTRVLQNVAKIKR